MAEDFSSVLSHVCKYQSGIAKGLELVGLEGSAAIEEGVCTADKLFTAAKEVINLVNDAVDCVEIHYNLKHYESYWDSHNDYDIDFPTNVGAFAGKQFKYTKGCDALTKNLAKTAWSMVSSRRLAEIDIVDAATSPENKRVLKEVTDKQYSLNPNCKYCLPEAEFIDFF